MQQSENIKVVLKFRPQQQNELNQTHIWAFEENKIVIQPQFSKNELFKQLANKQYVFDAIYSEKDSNSAIYSGILKEILESCLLGINGCIFTYGQQNSGKSVTLHGIDYSKEINLELKNIFTDLSDIKEVPLLTDGLIYHAMKDLFELIQIQNSKYYIIEACYFGVYNDKLYDWLGEGSNQQDVQIFQQRDEFVPKNNKCVNLKNIEDLSKLIRWVQNFFLLQVKNNPDFRTRIHQILKINIRSYQNDYIKYLKQNPSSTQEDFQNCIDNNDTLVTESQFYFVEFSGIEKENQQYTPTQPKNRYSFDIDADTSESLIKNSHILEQSKIKERLETKYINQGIFFFNQIIESRSKGEKHVPYRNSTLTKLLKNILSGKSRIFLILCASPYFNSFDQTWSTIKFGQIARQVKNEHLIDEQNQFSTCSSKKKVSKFIRKSNELISKDLNSKSKYLSKTVALENQIVDESTIMEPKIKDNNFEENSLSVSSYFQNNQEEQQVLDKNQPEHIFDLIQDLQQQLQHSSVINKNLTRSIDTSLILKKNSRQNPPDTNIIDYIKNQEQLQNSFQKLVPTLKEKQKTIIQLQQQINQLNSNPYEEQISFFKSSLQAKDNIISSISKELQQIQNQLKIKGDENNYQQMHIANLIKQKDSLQIENLQLKKQIDQQDLKKSQYQIKKKDQEANVEKLKQNIIDIEKKFENYIRQNQEKLKDSSNQYQRQLDENQNLMAKYQDLQKSFNSLKDQMNEANKKQVEYIRNCQSVEKNLQIAQNSNVVLLQQNEQYKTSVFDLQNKLDALQDKYNINLDINKKQLENQQELIQNNLELKKNLQQQKQIFKKSEDSIKKLEEKIQSTNSEFEVFIKKYKDLQLYFKDIIEHIEKMKNQFNFQFNEYKIFLQNVFQRNLNNIYAHITREYNIIDNLYQNFYSQFIKIKNDQLLYKYLVLENLNEKELVFIENHYFEGLQKIKQQIQYLNYKNQFQNELDNFACEKILIDHPKINFIKQEFQDKLEQLDWQIQETPSVFFQYAQQTILDELLKNELKIKDDLKKYESLQNQLKQSV